MLSRFFFSRQGLSEIDCVLCGKKKKQSARKKYSDTADKDTWCQCPTVSKCHHCTSDMQSRDRKTSAGVKPPYLCQTHGRYRQYQDYLIEFKNWCIIWVTVSIIPLGLIIFQTGIDLNWIFYVGAIVTIPCFPPVMLSILWVKATGKGLIAGMLY